ncbi:MAG TPA: glycosyltransferase family 39 protein [Albitalea sp.]|nr:glycosyltransferase family 39 protein [Albitalea sp.]
MQIRLRNSPTLQLAAIAVSSFAWLAATAWARPLMLPDEGRYVGIAWEMMRSGDWLTPTLNGLPFFHKPPLFYWITAASMSVFGPHEWAARAAPLLGAWLGAFALYLFARRWWDERSARLALIVLLVQPLFYIGGQFANLDMLVAGCITATVLLLADAALSVERDLPYRRALIAAHAAAALGVLAKGLIGAVIPALVMLVWLVSTRRWRAVRSLVSLPGLSLFAAIVMPWFVAMQARHADFLNYFVVVQHFKRFAAGGFNNVQPLWFYPAVLLLLSLPWLPALRPLLRRGYFVDTARGPIRQLLWLWVGLVVLFFSIPQSKLIGYVLPAVAPLALLMADGVLALAERSRRAARLPGWSAAVSAILSLGAVAALSVHSPGSTRDLARALGARLSPHEPVLMLGHYFYDLPLYARLRAPVEVVDDWISPDVRRLDNWRKELADAGDFAPGRAAALLIDPAAFRAAVCASPVSWVIGPTASAVAHPFLYKAQAVFSQRDTTLWRIDTTLPGVAETLQCAGGLPEAAHPVAAS